MKMGTRSVIADIAIVGAGAKLPGASSVDAFWDTLKSQKNTVSEGPDGRWSIGRFLRPGAPEPGFAYTFAGGYLTDPFKFDPALFGISHREARQMDPQQRMLLEVAWSAFEDADIPASSLAGQNVGVFVGASNVDYQNSASHDPAVMESHYMTGNSLSVLSNRLSHAFDLRGPSFTVDSACSSSFVALNEAMSALKDERIDLAIVAAANLLLSPAPFIGFSQAHMLSPTGRCRPFSENADGYVRSEGAVVLLLRRLKDARASGERVRSVIMGSAVNSDGYTPGISLPSLDGQRHLLGSLYADLGINANQLAFVEAHGTGTKAGDPIEAAAIGESLGKHRTTPLIIGSAKSNVGHLECVSGLVGLLKSSLAMEHRLLPKSLFSEELNTAIPFDDLNLRVASQAVGLARQPGQDRMIAGICNYGFGGTNAHVVVAEGDQISQAEAPASRQQTTQPQIIVVSAASKDALKVRAGQISDALAKGTHVADLANALGHRRDILQHRIVMPLAKPADVAASLLSFEHDGTIPAGLVSSASWEKNSVAFVFTGNGCQYKEMGQLAYLRSELFRREIDAIDRFFKPLSGWSIGETIKAGLDSERMAMTSVSQPMIYAIQSAIVSVLARFGIKPNVVLGHSMGEVAAAEASGILSREEAVKVIYLRSNHQESVRGQGTMMVIAACDERTKEMITAFANPDVEIAAINSPTSTTVSGPARAIEEFARECRKSKVATVRLDIDYPFHSSVLDSCRSPLIKDLSQIIANAGSIPMISTVTGEEIEGERLTGGYWWENIRSPVFFRTAVERAFQSGTGCFIEIGPKSILSGAIKDTLRTLGVDGQTMNTLSDKDPSGVDPIMDMISKFVGAGLSFKKDAVFGSRRTNSISIPPYPMQRSELTLGSTSERVLAYGKMVNATKRHALLGDRVAGGSPEWRNLLDPAILPYLADHQVDGAVVVPASGLAEMTLQVGLELYGNVPLEVSELDVLKALSILPGEIREISTRWAQQSETLEIWSRKRFSEGDNEWILHARGTVHALKNGRRSALAPPVKDRTIQNSRAEVYEEATRAGLEYGPAFRLVKEIERDEVTTDSRLGLPTASADYMADYVLHPISFDAALHGLFISRPQKEGETKAYMPVRLRNICVWEHGVEIHRAITLLTNETDRFKTVSVSLFSEEGSLIASVEAVVLRAVYLSKATVPDRTFHTSVVPLTRPDLAANIAAIRSTKSEDKKPITPAWLLVRAFCVSLAQNVVRRLMEDGFSASTEALASSSKVAPEAANYFDALYKVLSEYGPVPGKADFNSLKLPSPAAILATLMQRFPSANMEIRLVADALENAERFIRTGQLPAPTQWLLRNFESESLLTAPSVNALSETLYRLSEGLDVPLRVLAIEPFGRAITRAVNDLVEAGRIEVTFASRNSTELEMQRHEFHADSLVDGLVLNEDTQNSPLSFDVLIGFAIGPLAGEDVSVITDAMGLLKTSAPVVIAVPGADTSLNMLRGLWEPWLEKDGDGNLSGKIPAIDAVMRRLRKAGVQDIESFQTTDGLGNLVIGQAGVRKFDGEILEHLAETGRLALVTDDGAASLAADFLGYIEVINTGSSPEDAMKPWLQGTEDGEVSTLILLPNALEKEAGEQLALRIDYLKSLLECIDASQKTVRLFVVTETLTAHDPIKVGIERAIRGFVRVAINEYPGIDLHLIDLLPGADIEVVAKVVAMPGNEREWQIDANGASVLRIRRGITPPQQLTEEKRSVLRFEYPGRLDSYVWESVPRRELALGEVEVEVAAIGLNFRDVLVGLGILDDDLLGAGLTAASLGFECSGRVSRVGPGVTRFNVGDPVMGFAKDAFTSHVISPAWHFFPTPPGVDIEAAATIPVAFVTAWYSLVERAGLKAGEDVLIHGAAGGVGQAAIQIARRIGARILATASSDMRRCLGKIAGADLLFDSRQEKFEEEIASTIGGVDVVLNSLAGKGMLSSFRLVKPFGRFIELGKRDFLDNTLLGLRPFVRNLQYSGVDLDELLAHDRGLVEKLVADISEAFAKRELMPLPYQVFEACDVGRAFRSLQASEHVGKIVVRPPKVARENLDAVPFVVQPGTYLVVGGAGGFGFATARWLAAKGATKLVLASRRGALEPAIADEVELLQEQGVEVIVEALDVRDANAVRNLVSNVSARHGAIRGVIHAAVALDDALISSLSPERLRGVLGAKVDGLINLDAALADHELDFFVAYSSATTLIGSPGQSAYVAANAFLEGFMETRRAQGKPGLALGWGAISDAGIIARDRSLADRLRRTTGVVGIRSSEALAQLGRLLVMGSGADAVQFYSNIAPSEAAGKLALINSPGYSGLNLIRKHDGMESGEDISGAIADATPEEALAIVTRMIRREVAQILRMPEAQIDPASPMSELGLDSLMALELQLGIERLAGVQVPLVGINNRRLGDVAAMVLHNLGVEVGPSEEADDFENADVMRLLEAHVVDGGTAKELYDMKTQAKPALEKGAAQ